MRGTGAIPRATLAWKAKPKGGLEQTLLILNGLLPKRSRLGSGGGALDCHRLARQCRGTGSTGHGTPSPVARDHEPALGRIGGCFRPGCLRADLIPHGTGRFMDRQHARCTGVRGPDSEPSANAIADTTGSRMMWLPMHLTAIPEQRRSDQTGG